jgi:hypothetical protein
MPDSTVFRARRPVLLLALTVFASAIGLVAASAPAHAAPVPFQRGVTVGEWGPTAYQPATMKKSFKRLRKLHVNTVTLFVVYMQRDGSSNSVGPGSETVSTGHLVKAIRLAKAAGLRVILRPYVDRDDAGWRGDITPASVDGWFASYSSFVLKYAKLAQKQRVSGFVVGSELVSMSGLADRWRGLTAGVRGAFRGFVSYQANWDEAVHVTWWDAVDAISISGYYPLSAEPDPTVATLAGGWKGFVESDGKVQNWFGQVDALRTHFGKPVFFGEIGYRPVTGTAGRPWSTDRFGSFSSTAQVNPYEAAFQVWYRVPWFRGFEWWIVPPQKRPVSQTSSAGHEPLPAALQVLKRYYGAKR